MSKEEVYISYAWKKPTKGKKIQDPIIAAIQKVLKPHFNLIIDKDVVNYID